MIDTNTFEGALILSFACGVPVVALVLAVRSYLSHKAEEQFRDSWIMKAKNDNSGQ
jgi:hypothetical protein